MQKMSGELYRSIRLCVDSYENGVLCGRFYHASLDDACPFRSLTQFLVKVEQMLDEANYPQSYTAKRSFLALPELKTGVSSGELDRTGKLGTFVIRLMFRQHTSWQGSVTWEEGKGEESFRSVLELILLLDSALGGCESEEDKPERNG